MKKIRRINPSTGAVVFKLAGDHGEVLSKTPTGLSFGQRADLFAENALGFAIGLQELGRGLRFGPLGVPLDVDGSLRLSQGFVMAIAAVAASDNQLASIMKNTEVVSLVGILVMIEKNLAAAIRGDSEVSWDEIVVTAHNYDIIYKLIKGISDLHTKPQEGQELVLVSAAIDVLRGIDAIINATGNSTSDQQRAPKKSSEKTDRPHGPERPPKDAIIGDFPEHIPRPGKDGIMLSSKME
jgi:hypothetical protein